MGLCDVSIAVKLKNGNYDEPSVYWHHLKPASDHCTGVFSARFRTLCQKT